MQPSKQLREKLFDSSCSMRFAGECLSTPIFDVVVTDFDSWERILFLSVVTWRHRPFSTTNPPFAALESVSGDNESIHINRNNVMGFSTRVNQAKRRRRCCCHHYYLLNLYHAESQRRRLWFQAQGRFSFSIEQDKRLYVPTFYYMFRRQKPFVPPFDSLVESLNLKHFRFQPHILRKSNHPMTFISISSRNKKEFYITALLHILMIILAFEVFISRLPFDTAVGR